MEKKDKKLTHWDKFIHSFDNTPHGFSARKLSAFIAVSSAIYATYEFVDTTTVISALMVWLIFALLCLGIVTAEQVLKFKGEIEKKSNDNNTNEEVEEGAI